MEAAKTSLLTNTSNEATSSQTCQAVFETTSRTLPIVSLCIAGIGVSPGLQASVVDVLGGAFAHAWSNQAAAFVLIDHIWGLQEAGEIIGRSIEGRLNGL